MVLLAASAMAGCSGKDEQQASEEPAPASADQTKPQMFQTQINALDKAKGVEGTIQQGADRDRQQIEDQSQ